MKTSALLLMLLLLPVQAFATPRLDDFAAGLVLEGLFSDTAVYRLYLPALVYTGTFRSDLGDLCIFNAEGDPVPLLLRRPESIARQNEQRQQLAIFPLYHQQGELSSDNLKVQLQQGTTATTIKVITGTDDNSNRRVGGYLIALTRKIKSIDALELDWVQSENDVMASATVELSHDLDSWTPLVAKATVTQKSFQQKSISQRRIELNPSLKITERTSDAPLYLRLLWDNPATAIALTSITAIRKTITKTQPPYHWLPLAPDSKQQSECAVFDYDSHGHFPVDRIRLRFPHHNSAYSALIYSKNDPKHEWQLRYKGTFSTLDGTQSGEKDASINVHSGSSRFWRVRICDSMLELSEEPTLELGWIGDELLFLSKGRPPFTLAYGSAVLAEEQLPKQSLLLQDILAKNLHYHLQEVSCGKELILGGKARLQPLPSPFPWKQWFLWALLIGGVAMICWMALILFRDRSGTRKLP